MSTQTTKVFAYVGVYTNIQPYARGRADGINVYSLDTTSGAMHLVQSVAGPMNPTFLTLDPAQRHLYSVVSVPEIDGHDGGALSAYDVDPVSGRLTYLNRESVMGPGPCFVTVDATSSFAIAANYPGGSVAMLPIESDGRLGVATDFIQHVGSSVHMPNQERAHAHSVFIDAANRFALICDLGMDKIMSYRLDLEKGKLIPNTPPWVSARPGAGPRHLSFHPNGRYAYVINELDATMSAYTYDATKGELREMQAVASVPSDYHGDNAGAEVRVAPSGKFVYASNRGHDSIVIYAIDEASGLLTYVGHEPSQGRNPRNFNFSPDGKLMLVANQDSDTIVAFRIDRQTGKLTPTGQITASPSPVCVKFAVFS